VVLHRLTKHGVIVADPAHEVAQLSREAFCRRWMVTCSSWSPNTLSLPRGRGAHRAARGAGLSACCVLTRPCWWRPSAAPSS
jgi:hypothetical protein